MRRVITLTLFDIKLVAPRLFCPRFFVFERVLFQGEREMLFLDSEQNVLMSAFLWEHTSQLHISYEHSIENLLSVMLKG